MAASSAGRKSFAAVKKPQIAVPTEDEDDEWARIRTRRLSRCFTIV